MIDGTACARDLGEIAKRLETEAREGMVRVVKAAYRSARATTRFQDQTTELRGSIDIIERGPYRQRLIWRAKHARYLTEGTPGHGPANARVMTFKIGGRWISTRWVKGIEKRPFDEDARTVGSNAMETILREGAERAVNYP